MNTSTVIFTVTWGLLDGIFTVLAMLLFWFVAMLINEVIYAPDGDIKPFNMAVLIVLTTMVAVVSYMYLSYFAQYLLILIGGITAIFVYYMFNYVFLFWHPLWDIIGKITGTPESQYKQIHHSMKYCLMKLRLYWSMQGFTSERDKKIRKECGEE